MNNTLQFQSAKDFIWRCDQLGFRYFIDAFGTLAFQEGPAWVLFDELRTHHYPGREAMKLALIDLRRIEAPQALCGGALLVFNFDEETKSFAFAG